MKEWNKPQLLSLGVENTFEVCDCGASLYKKDDDEPKNKNYCHRDGIWHKNNCASIGHDQNNGCNGTEICDWSNDPHKSKCCCVAITEPGVPGLS